MQGERPFASAAEAGAERLRLMLDLQGVQGAARHAGLGRFSLELARALIRGRGAHEVQILLNTRLTASAARLAEEFTPLLGAHNLRRWQAPEGSAAAQLPQAPLRRLAEHLRAQAITDCAPDLVHVGSVFEGLSHDIVTTWPAELERPPIAATVHDLIPLTLRETYLDGHWRAAGLVPWYARCLDELAACAPLLANSEATRNEVLRHLGLSPDRVVVIGGGASPGFSPPAKDAAARAALLRKYGLREGFLLYLGAGDHRKNERLLLRAHAALPPGLRGRHPLAIGHVNPPHLLAQAREAGLAEADLIALPFVEEADLPGLYAACEIFVMPSLAEGFGLPVLEAMACGAACIASNVSALPEVMGRADALFDPHDAPALAVLLQRLLETPELLADLRAYGPRRARDFSWDRVAARAWSAFEGAARPPKPVRPSQRLRLAIVSPVPPVQSGIADYTAELAPALAPHYAITLVSAEPPQGTLAGRMAWISEEDFAREGGGFDRVLYQMGNNTMHAFMLNRLLPRIPGLVTLHEAAITDLRNWLDHRPEASEPRLHRLVREEGYHAIFSASELAGSAGPLAEALGVVVHSGHARSLLHAEYGEAALAHASIIPLLRDASSSLDARGRQAARATLGVAEDALLIGSFGLVTRHKLPERILEGFAAVARHHPTARLVFVGGDADGSGSALLALAERRGLSQQLLLTGHAPPETYRLWLAATDLAVQLRRSSRGETSAAAKDVLMAGLPLIANRHGSMAEMEESGCRLIDEAAELTDLTDALLDLADDAPARLAMGLAARLWAATELNPRRIATAYRNVLEHAYQHGRQAGLAAWLASSRDIPLAGRAAGALGEAMAATFPSPRQPRIWLDTALSGLELGIAMLMREGLGVIRVEPCRLVRTGIVTAHDWAWLRLGLEGAPPENGPAILTPSDVLVSAEPLGGELALATGARFVEAIQPGSTLVEGAAQRLFLLRMLGG